MADFPTAMSAAGTVPGAATTDPPPVAIRVEIRYFAAARAAAGTAEEQLDVRCAPTGCTVGAVLEAAVTQHGPGLETVLRRCSYLLDELAVHGRSTPVRDGQRIDVLPPFAGG